MFVRDKFNINNVTEIQNHIINKTYHYTFLSTCIHNIIIMCTMKNLNILSNV